MSEKAKEGVDKAKEGAEAAKDKAQGGKIKPRVGKTKPRKEKSKPRKEKSKQHKGVVGMSDSSPTCLRGLLVCENIVHRRPWTFCTSAY